MGPAARRFAVLAGLMYPVHSCGLAARSEVNVSRSSVRKVLPVLPCAKFFAMSSRGDYWAKAAARAGSQRKRRLRNLRAVRAELTEARTAAALFRPSAPQILNQFLHDQHSLDVVTDHTVIPRSFVRSTSAEGDRPPQSRLIARQGDAVRVYALLHYLDQSPTTRPTWFQSINDVPITRAKSRPTWPALLGFPRALDDRASTARMHRAFSALEELNLIQMPSAGVRGRYRDVSLARGRSRAVGVHLPLHLFTSGWLLALTPPELAVYFMLRDVRDGYRRRAKDAIFVPRARRLTAYGISDEVYLAHRELAEFGLITTIDPVRGRRRGKIRPPQDAKLLPFEFVIHRGGFIRDAYETVVNALTRDPVPPRLRVSEWGSVIRREPVSALRASETAEAESVSHDSEELPFEDWRDDVW